jgi:hypothetical protein
VPNARIRTQHAVTSVFPTVTVARPVYGAFALMEK